MPSLRDFRDRITSVKSTKKITSAMKMVAAAKLRKAQEQAEASQPYALAMSSMLSRVAAGVAPGSGPELLVGTGKSDVHLMIVVSSDRGLCGGVNANLLRFVMSEITRLEKDGKTVKIVCVGRKAKDFIKRSHADKIVESFTGITGQRVTSYEDADKVAQMVLAQFGAGEFDVCSLIYNEFHSVLTQRPKSQQLIPFAISVSNDNDTQAVETDTGTIIATSQYDFEPEESVILGQLLPKNIGVQIFGALLDSSAGEQAARMTAMDNATRNAGERINDLTLQYNRARQAYITKELIEIISGAEAV